jgi:hypothetical protein
MRCSVIVGVILGLLYPEDTDTTFPKYLNLAFLKSCKKSNKIPSRAVFLNRWAAARYQALASIIMGRENLSF